MYPYTRLRRTRKSEWIRNLVAETSLSARDLILPIFIIDGLQVREEIESMPGIFRFSIDEAIKEIEMATNLGISAFALFPSIKPELKTPNGNESINPDGLVCRAIREIKKNIKGVGIICDVALDPYTSHGHDGIVIDDYVNNDETLHMLVKQSLVLAEAGADILAPSDMMDGRIGLIRENLEHNKFTDISIISYAAKYASNFYGPFRDAVQSSANLSGASKKTYQMDFRNSREAILEASLDIEEGADIIMVKPGILYLDIISKLVGKNLPVFAYQVSGEYSMLKFAAKAGALNYENCLIESLTCLKRAGAKSIFTYGA
ncbi:MAG: porphobilinogen synthase, partial [Alphaproteobacteria bacterium]|nr:porphobilinogen synthase [Alphaproteobacteria bacterium]